MAYTKVLIGVTTGEYARRADFYDYFHMLQKPEGTMMIFCHDRSPAHGRNLIIEAAIENNCSHILFIDDDMAYKPDALMKLLEHDVDIVSGLYLSRAYPHAPLAFDLAAEDGSACPVYLMGGEKRLTPIVAAGFGFLLVNTRIFQFLEKPYVRLGELDSEQWCDDIGFFNRVRKAGIQSFVDFECLIGHIGTMIIWPNQMPDGRWMTGYDTGGTQGMVNHPQITTNKPKYEFEET